MNVNLLGFFKSGSMIWRIVFVQYVFAIVLAVGIAAVSIEAGYSILLGGLIIAIPNTLVARRMGREVARADKALRYIVSGQLGKLLLTAFLFGIVFTWVEVLALEFLFLGVLLNIGCNILVPLVDQYL